jgi:hypothetical protein
MNWALGAASTWVPKPNTKVPMTAANTTVIATSSIVPMIGETPFLPTFLFNHTMHTPFNKYP